MIETLRIVWNSALVRPLESGLVRPSHWHPTLRLLGGVMAALLLIGAGTVLATPFLRAGTDLVEVWPGIHMPAATMPLIAVGLWFCLTLLNTAALRVGWPLKLLALAHQLAGCLLLMPVSRGSWLLWASLGGVVLFGLLLFLPRRPGFRTWEFMTVALLTFVSTTLPLQGTMSWLSLGHGDLRPTLLGGQLQLVLILAVPSLTVAGATLTQLSAQIGLATGTALTTRGAPRWLIGLLVGLLLWRSWSILSDALAEPPDHFLPSLLWAAIAVLGSWLAWRGLQGLASRGPAGGPVTLIEPFTAVSYLLVLASGLGLLLPSYATVATLVMTLTGTTAPPWLTRLTELGNLDWFTRLFRVLAGLVLVGLGVRMARRRGIWQVGALAATFVILQAFSLAAAVVPVDLHLSITPTAIAVWLHLALVAATVWVLADGQWRPRSAALLLGVAAAQTLGDFRFILDDPLAALFGASAVAALLIGLMWRLLTDGEFTHEESRLLPRDSRILLYLASAGFAITFLVFGAAVRSNMWFIDLETVEEHGDWVYAPALLVTLSLVGVTQAVAADSIPPPTRPPNPVPPVPPPPPAPPGPPGPWQRTTIPPRPPRGSAWPHGRP